MPPLAIDFDDVIFPCNLELHRLAAERLGVPLPPRIGYFLHESLPISPEDNHRLVPELLASERLLEIPPLPGAVEALAALAARHELFVVSSRDDRLREWTIRYLERHVPVAFSDVFCLSYYSGLAAKRAKHELCRELGIRTIVDDSLQNATGYIDAGMRVVLFGEYSWNRPPEPLPGLYPAADWAAVPTAVAMAELDAI